jgi:hypothetical protein
LIGGDAAAASGALETASEAARAANHAAYHAPATPESLYDRTGTLVELLGRLRQVAFTLGDHVERAPAAAMRDGLVLDSDDGMPVAEYVHEPRRRLADAAAELEDARQAANEAWSVLSHLKLSDP